MDIGDIGGEGLSEGGFEDEKPQKPKALPDDLPRSLDDRRNVATHYPAETEMYDAWQGTSSYNSACVTATNTT